MTQLTRRAVIAAAAVARPSCLQSAARPRAAAPASGQQAAGFYRFKIGSYEITAINDGTWHRAAEPTKFVKNASPRRRAEGAVGPVPAHRQAADPVHDADRQHRLEADPARHRHRRPDGAAPPARCSANLAAAGIDPKAVDTIVISHFHPDHINGIKTKDNAKVFPNAEIKVPAPEWAFWMDDAKMKPRRKLRRRRSCNARRIFGDIARRGEALRARQGSRARHHLDRGARPYARPHRLRDRVGQPVDARISPTPPTIRGCSCAIRNGRRSSTWTAPWRSTTARSCSTVPRPTG